MALWSIGSIKCISNYAFSASASDYYDQEGVHHSGIVSTNNRLQFGVISN